MQRRQSKIGVSSNSRGETMNNIKKLFPEFYQDKIKTGDFDKKEKNIIVLDTNYLLDILQLSTELASQYVEAIENIQELIYIPYLVALEFNFGKSGIKKGNSIIYKNISRVLRIQ